jgi:hypothetical protein
VQGPVTVDSAQLVVAAHVLSARMKKFALH